MIGDLETGTPFVAAHEGRVVIFADVGDTQVGLRMTAAAAVQAALKLTREAQALDPDPTGLPITAVAGLAARGDEDDLTALIVEAAGVRWALCLDETQLAELAAALAQFSRGLERGHEPRGE